MTEHVAHFLSASKYHMSLDEGPFLPHLRLLAALGRSGDKSFPRTTHALQLQICECSFSSVAG